MSLRGLWYRCIGINGDTFIYEYRYRRSFLCVSLTNMDSAKRDSAKRDSAKRDSAKRDSAERDSAERDSAKRNSAKRVSAKRDSMKWVSAKRDSAKRDSAKREGTVETFQCFYNTCIKPFELKKPWKFL